jgi:hypothetical protein
MEQKSNELPSMRIRVFGRSYSFRSGRHYGPPRARIVKSPRSQENEQGRQKRRLAKRAKEKAVMIFRWASRIEVQIYERLLDEATYERMREMLKANRMPFVWKTVAGRCALLALALQAEDPRSS